MIENVENKLATLATLGSLMEGTEFDITFKRVFKETFDKLREDENISPIEAFTKANVEAGKQSIKHLPVLMRINFCINSINNIREQLGTHTDETIDWDNINEILEYRNENDLTDYNNFEKVSSISDLEKIRIDMSLAISDIIPWIKSTCKDCKEEFTLNFSEVNYFIDKGLNLPKRCKSCRDARKNGTNVKIKPKESIISKKEMELKNIEKRIEENEKAREEFKTSSMTEALKKAGF